MSTPEIPAKPTPPALKNLSALLAPGVNPAGRPFRPAQNAPKMHFQKPVQAVRRQIRTPRGR